jgi:hypothetical protein
MAKAVKKKVAVRAIVIYQHALIRDVAVGVLRKAGVEVAAIHARDLDPATLRALHPDVLIVDQAARTALEGVGPEVLLCPRSGSFSKIIAIGLTDPTMVVYCRALVENATIQNLVEAALGSWKPTIPPSHETPEPGL